MSNTLEGNLEWVWRIEVQSLEGVGFYYPRASGVTRFRWKPFLQGGC